MAIYSTYKGAQLDLAFYQGRSTIDYPIEMLNDDETDYDFSNYSSVACKVYYRQHGEEILTPTVTTSTNFINLDVTKAQSAALQLREYWYEIYGVMIDPLAEHELLTFGWWKVV